MIVTLAVLGVVAVGGAGVVAGYWLALFNVGGAMAEVAGRPASTATMADRLQMVRQLFDMAVKKAGERG